MRRIWLVLAVAIVLAATPGFLGVASAQETTTAKGGTTSKESTATKDSTVQADSSQLILQKIKPANGATNVARDTDVRATFNEKLDPATVNSTNFQLKDTDTNTVVPATVRVSNNNPDVAVLTPDQNLKRGDHYKVTITGGASGVLSRSGDRLKGVDGSGADFHSNQNPPTATWTFKVQT